MFDRPRRLPHCAKVEPDLAHLPRRIDLAEAGGALGERPDEALAAHLSVGDDVDAGDLLVGDRSG